MTANLKKVTKSFFILPFTVLYTKHENDIFALGKKKSFGKKKRQNKNVVLCIQWTDVYKRLSELSNAPYYNVRNAGWVRNINLLRFPACIHANEWLPKSEY